MSKRNKVTTIIMLPFVAFTFIIGWCLSATGEKTNHQTEKHLAKHLAHHRAS